MPDKLLIQKYFQGQATQEEARIVMDYLASEDADSQSLHAYMQEVEIPEVIHESGSGLKDPLLIDLRSKLYPGLTQPSPSRGIQIRYITWAVAASILLLGAIGTFLYHKNRSAALKPVAVWKTLSNPDIRTRLAILPDGTQAYLSPNSTLTYASDFSTHRAILLVGEAFFEVVSDQMHPFEVQGGRVKVRVLGTAFNLEAYPSENLVKVSLVKGRVSVNDTAQGGDAKLLNAGQCLTFDKRSDKMLVDILKVNTIRDWENGYTIFNDIPVRAALERISGQFGMHLDIKAPKDLEGRHVSGVFKQAPLRQTLDIILFISRYKYKIQGDTLHVFPGHG